MSDPKPTDVHEFIENLDAGLFERKLAVALSQTAAAVIDNDKPGEVTVRFAFKKIPGTAQVHIGHRITFTKPTQNGKTIEEDERTTPLHVGRAGHLSLSPENQLAFFNRDGHITQE